MEKRERNKNIFVTIICMTVYEIYFTVFIYMENKYHLIISIKDVNAFNLLQKSVCDFFLFFLPTFLFCYLSVHSFTPIPYLKPNKWTLLFLLLFISAFLLKGDFTVNGIYSFIFYFGVGFSEEMVYRGYLYNRFSFLLNHRAGILISGIMWGISHEIMPAIMNGLPLWQRILFHTDWIGFTLLGMFYIFLMKRSGSVWNCILLHAFLDFGSLSAFFS